MTDKQLTILTDPPAAVEAGGPDDYGILSADALETAHTKAHEAYHAASALGEIKDDERARLLQAAVMDLADAVSALTGEAMQVARAVRTGRIAHAVAE